MKDFSQYVFILFSIVFSIGLNVYMFMEIEDRLDSIDNSQDIISQCSNYSYAKGDEN